MKKPTASAHEKGKFLTGSTMNHVIVMTATASLGLIAIFLVDVANLFYISQLGEQALAAAIGYASTIMFFSLSLSIGLSIASSALVSKAIGAGNMEDARMKATTSIIFAFTAVSMFSIFLFFKIEYFLKLLGATGKTFEIAVEFMHVVIPTMPIIGIALTLSGILRAVGDAKRSMYLTLFGGIATAIFDPILIFGLDMGVMGAAWAIWISRIVILALGFHATVKVHNMLGHTNFKCVKVAFKPYAIIALPTIATQLATPFGNAYVMQAVAEFGDSAVAGWTIIGRIIPVAFGVLFALSGAIGPIIGQNFGAKIYDRVYSAVKDSFIFVTLYTFIAWGLLALLNSHISDFFNASEQAAQIVQLFCIWLAASFLFNGLIFIASAAFNNLGKAIYSTIINWGRATLGVIPFVYVGKTWYGVEGAITGWALGAVMFGLISAIWCIYYVKNLSDDDASDANGLKIELPPTANSPFTTSKGSMT
jgi:putative MATE family efflux protein